MRASNGRSVARWNRLRADGRKSPAATHRHQRRCACTDISTHAGRFRTLVHGGEIDPLFLPRETPLESFLYLLLVSRLTPVSSAAPSSGARAIVLAETV